MRILVTSNKAISHFRPMLPFALSPRARGHDVRIAASNVPAGEISRHGFEHLVLVGPTQETRADVTQRASRLPREQVG